MENGEENQWLLVWTGSNMDGLRNEWPVTTYIGGIFPLYEVTYGVSWGSTNYTWIDAGEANRTSLNKIYAISEELTVVPEPGSIILAATGLFSSMLGLKRLRRKHQE